MLLGQWPFLSLELVMNEEAFMALIGTGNCLKTTRLKAAFRLKSLMAEWRDQKCWPFRT